LNQLDLSINPESSKPNNREHYNWLQQAAEWAETKWGYMRNFPGNVERINLLLEIKQFFYLAIYEAQDKNQHLVGTFALTPDKVDLEQEKKFLQSKNYVSLLKNEKAVSLKYVYVHDNFRDFGFGTQILNQAKQIAKKDHALMTAHLLTPNVHGFYAKRDAVFKAEIAETRAHEEPCTLIHFVK